MNISTVSRALNGSYGVKKKTRDHVLTVARSLNYRPNRIARGLVTGMSRSIGVLISDIRNPFFAEVARGAEDTAYESSFDVILCNSDLNPNKQMRYVRSLLDKHVEGILMNSVANLSREAREELASFGIPIVLLNKPFGQHPFSTISADNYEGGFLAGNYLVALGHQVIAHLTGPRNHGNLADRCKGFLKAVDSSGNGRTAIVVHGEHTQNGGYEMAKQLLSQHRDVTAIFAGNDATAFGALRAILEMGLTVPDQISLMGFDNVELSSLIHPPLTTIHQPKYEMGQAAVEILLKHSKSPRTCVPEQRVLGVNLVERKSCRAMGDAKVDATQISK